MFGTKVIFQAKRHAEEVYPQESCGLVVNGAYIPCRNVAANPLEHWEIAPVEYANALRTGALQAVVHSHPDGTDYPTYDDMRFQMASAVPWCIIPKDKDHFWFGDQCPISKLRGRVFKPGVFDCYTVIRDWYRLVKKVTLLNLPRHPEWWHNGENIYMDNFARAGFEQIDVRDVARGDVLLARIGFGVKVNNHAALYLGRGLILHHLQNRLSVREPIARWRNTFTVALRYIG